MGLFQHDVKILDSAGHEVAVVKCWVDTASNYTWLPAAIRDQLGIRPTREETFVLADCRRERRRIAQVTISIGAREDEVPFATFCAFANDGEEYLLGAVALEEAGLAVDMKNRRLVPADAYALTRLDGPVA
jgi:predicted aspartyl protease